MRDEPTNQNFKASLIRPPAAKFGILTPYFADYSSTFWRTARPSRRRSDIAPAED
jgi:hypothetical protein